MGSKIVNIVITIFMLIMCVMTMTTLSMVNMKNNQDHIIERTGSSVLSTDGEIKKENSVTVRGSSLISSINTINKINSKDNNIYKVDSKVNGNKYNFNLNGKTSTEDIVSAINEQAEYTLTYTFNNKDKTVNVKIEGS